MKNLKTFFLQKLQKTFDRKSKNNLRVDYFLCVIAFSEHVGTYVVRV
jgi:hypothetical protein